MDGFIKWLKEKEAALLAEQEALAEHVVNERQLESSAVYQERERVVSALKLANEYLGSKQ